MINQKTERKVSDTAFVVVVIAVIVKLIILWGIFG